MLKRKQTTRDTTILPCLDLINRAIVKCQEAEKVSKDAGKKKERDFDTIFRQVDALVVEISLSIWYREPTQALCRFSK